MSEVLALILGGWSKFFKFLLLLALTFVILLAFAGGVLRLLPHQTSELKIGSGDLSASILFAQPTEAGQEYLVMVAPQGWEETGIAVREGDAVSFEAGGRVNVDLEGLNLSLQARHNAEERVKAAEMKAGRWEKEKNDFVLEQHFTPQEVQSSIPHWRWNGPDGLRNSDRYANPARKKRAIIPQRDYGALVAAIRETGVTPSRDDAFFVGKSNTIRAQRTGKLYFAVNDVLNDTNKDFPDMFLVDNIGFFYVRVTVTPAK
ncbi:MAG TPA: hypothetical protein VKE71_05210 [Candidatus Angelobacter sp.]|nr:hypothetical protein [Candidatus Angelobacter sp.]